MDNQLLTAYKETNYWVNSFKNPLKIGMENNDLKDLYTRNKITSSAYITAYNPFSKELSDTENKERNNQLLKDCIEYKHFQGEGKHPSNEWPGEPSFLFLGMDLETASTIGKKYEQNAILWIDKDAIPQLINLRISLKPFKFTLHYRKTIFAFIDCEFTEQDFINQLSDANKLKWNALTPEKRKQLWLKLKTDFPFEIGCEPLDPHNNWIEAWDTDENEETIETWDHHEYLKEEITNKISELEDELEIETET